MPFGDLIRSWPQPGNTSAGAAPGIAWNGAQFVYSDNKNGQFYLLDPTSMAIAATIVASANRIGSTPMQPGVALALSASGFYRVPLVTGGVQVVVASNGTSPVGLPSFDGANIVVANGSIITRYAAPAQGGSLWTIVGTRSAPAVGVGDMQAIVPHPAGYYAAGVTGVGGTTAWLASFTSDWTLVRSVAAPVAGQGVSALAYNGRHLFMLIEGTADRIYELATG